MPVAPLLLLTYALQTPVRSLLGPIGELGDAFAVPALLLFATLLMAGGGCVVWDVASAISRAAQLATATGTSDLPSGRVRQDEIGTLVESFGKMLATMEHQADEINQFPRGPSSSRGRPSTRSSGWGLRLAINDFGTGPRRSATSSASRWTP